MQGDNKTKPPTATGTPREREQRTGGLESWNLLPETAETMTARDKHSGGNTDGRDLRSESSPGKGEQRHLDLISSITSQAASSLSSS